MLLKERNSVFIPKIDDLIPVIQTRLETQVPKIFPAYTLHNIQHSKRVLEYIPDLVDDIKRFNDLELTLMFYSALLHDVGMALGEKDISKIKDDKFKFENNSKYSVYKKLYGDDALLEIIRKNHADISSEIIENDHLFTDKFMLQDPLGVSYKNDISLLCKSHTKDHLWLSENLSEHNIKGIYDYNLRHISYLLRIADLLDIDQSRTPLDLYKLINPPIISDEEWRKHFVITNIKKVEFDKKRGKKNIVFYGDSSDIKIHRKLLAYINWINAELKHFADFAIQLDDDKFNNNLSETVVNKISTNGFKISDYKLSLDFRSITELLMGENIYGDKKLGLREIIQNSIDACLIRKEIEEIHTYMPTITIEINSEENVFYIRDNGIGMSEEIIKGYFLNIGKSYYRSDIFKINDFEYNPIGNFGIGFLSCFMLSDEVKIETRYYKNKEKHIIELENGDEYIGFNSVNDPNFTGTSISLKLDNVLNAFQQTNNEVEKFINEYFVNNDFNLIIIDNKEQRNINIPIEKYEIEKKNIINIDISTYLDKVKGFISIRNTHKFLKTVHDLNIKSKYIYFIENGKLDKMNKSLKDTIHKKSNSLTYLHIPIYDNCDRDDFEKVYEILDNDIDATMDKIDPIDNIYIFYPPENQSELHDKETFDFLDEDLFDENITIQDLLELHNSDTFAPKIIKNKINIFEKENIETLEEYKIVKFHKYSWYRESNEKINLFLRSILVKDFTFENQLMAKTISLVGLTINVYLKEIVPNISRNELLPESNSLLNNTINLVTHLAAIDNFKFNDEEKQILIEFIKTKLLINPHLVTKERLQEYGL